MMRKSMIFALACCSAFVCINAAIAQSSWVNIGQNVYLDSGSITYRENTVAFGMIEQTSAGSIQRDVVAVCDLSRVGVSFIATLNRQGEVTSSRECSVRQGDDCNVTPNNAIRHAVRHLCEQ